MKQIFFSLMLLCGASFAQNYEHKWSVGIHGGNMQYWGDLGNSFYKFDKAFYGNGGISVSRYLNRHWDASVFATRGVVGYFGDWDPLGTRTNFLANITTVNLLGRYNFLNPESWVRPYLTAGGAVLLQSGSGESYVYRGKGTDYALPQLGAGLKFQFGKFLGMQIQELLMYNWFDDIDGIDAGANDLYLLHTIGITCNIGKLGKLGAAEPTGVGDQIDKCPKVKQYRNKGTKMEDKKLRKEKKQKRKIARKNRDGFFSRIFKRNRD